MLQYVGRTIIRAGGNSGRRRQHSWRCMLTLTLNFCSRWPREIYYQVWKQICIAHFEAHNAWIPSLCWLQSASRLYLKRQQPSMWFKRWHLLFVRFLVGITMWMMDIKKQSVRDPVAPEIMKLVDLYRDPIPGNLINLCNCSCFHKGLLIICETLFFLRIVELGFYKRES